MIMQFASGGEARTSQQPVEAEQEVIDALTFAAFVDFDPTYGFFAQTTHFEYTPASRVRLRRNGM